MFFQFSPVRPEPKKKVVQKENESEKVEVLSLAPFTPNPKLFFEDIRVGDTVNRKLLIKNPTNRNINLFIRSNIPEELNVTLSWEQIPIEKGTESILEVTWHPLKEEFVRYMLTVEDGERIRRDVPIAFKSVSPKKSKAGAKPKSKAQKFTKKTSPTKKYYANKPPNISPKKKYSPRTKNVSPRKTSPLQSSIIIQRLSPSPRIKQQNLPFYMESPKTRNSKIKARTERHRTYTINGRENVPVNLIDISTDSNVFISPASATFRLDHLQPIERRETYVLNGNIEKSPSDSIFSDSLEAISPEISPLLKKSPQINRLFPKKSPLGISNRDNISPSTHQYNQQTLLKTPSTYDFEYKLTQLESFCFTPVSAPVNQKENLSPLSSTIENLILLKNSPEMASTVQTNRTFEVPLSSPNISTETYVKSNLSTETYVKGNSSFETYVKGNISGGTYTKDNSVGDINNLSFSPVSSKLSTSPSIPKPNINISQSTNYLYSDNARNIIESNMWSGIRAQPLYSIQEESYIHQETEAQSPQRSFLKRKSNFNNTNTSPKKVNVTGTPKDWSKTGGNAFRIAKQSTGLNLKQFIKNDHQLTNKEVAVITKQDTNRIIIQNPFLLAATNFADPFMTPSLYINEEWLNQQQIDFKKWLNALLTPPKELSSKEQVIDVAKVWQECKQQEVASAPSKEVVSSKYHTNHKLNSLRKSAQNLFRSKEMSTVLSKVILAVETGKLTIREDKDVHLNLALKSEIMSLLLSYNPLWLRIGLETIYNEIIPLRSNSDVMGLSTFIANRLLKDPYLIKKYKLVYNRKYIADFNKFFLKKFFVLVYFLDQAKNKKLIPHDPCLFCKKAPVKESKEMLIRLAREILAAVGDVTKFLKYLGYVVTHVQTYIHEFDYAVNSLGVDLRDGVRLTKVMEIILMQENLTSNLRVPAISRLQKVHNMKIVFNSLEKAGYKILYDISPKDIVDGHKEKTLSFLWQIIYKFQAPLMVKSATTIQTWFRSLPIALKRRQMEKARLKRENAARKIQAWYRHQKLSEKLLAFALMLERYLKIMRAERAATRIQSYFRMYRCRKVYTMLSNIVLNIQRFSRGWLVRNIYRERIKKAVVIQKHVRGYFARKRFVQLKYAASIIQTRYLVKKQMEKDHKSYIQLKAAAILIQRRYRANVLALREKNRYHKLKSATVCIQQRYKANKLCRIERQKYFEIHKAIIHIQTWYRSIISMRVCREDFVMLKKSTVIIEGWFLTVITRKRFLQLKHAAQVIQTKYRAKKQMEKDRTAYNQLKHAVGVIQSKYRAKKQMEIDRSSYKQLKTSVLFTQRLFRANLLATRDRKHYQALKSATTCIQQRYRAKNLCRIEQQRYLEIRSAAVHIQTWYRSIISMRAYRERFVIVKKSAIIIEQWYITVRTRREFLQLKHAASIIQLRYRAKRQMEEDCRSYNQLKCAANLIQTRYRAKIVMEKSRKSYTQLKTATIFIQRRFRANLLAVREKKSYQALRSATICIQQRYKANKLCKVGRQQYMEVRAATVRIQTWYRSIVSMRVCRQHFLMLKKSAITIEMRYLTVTTRRNFLRLKSATCIIQSRYRAKKQMEMHHTAYNQLKYAACVVQARYRAKKQMEKVRTSYKELKAAVLFVQRRLRANTLAVKEKKCYQELKSATLCIQQRYRANKLCQIERKRYMELCTAAVCIQTRYRSLISMRACRERFITLKKSLMLIANWYTTLKVRNTFLQLRYAANIIQTRYRAKKQMEMSRRSYNQLRTTTLFIQRKWRTNILAQKQKNHYQKLRSATITVQQLYRANKLCRIERHRYLEIYSAAIQIQMWYRATILMRTCRQRFLGLKNSVRIIERHYIALKTMQVQRTSYMALRSACICIQRNYRAIREMRIRRKEYLELQAAAVMIQRQYRAQITMRRARSKYVVLKSATILVQRHFRATISMRKAREHYKDLLIHTIFVQRRFRANKAMLVEKNYYTNLRKATIFIQRYWRAKQLCRHDRNKYRRLRMATVVIQHRWRAQRLMKLAIQQYTALKQSSVIIQRWYKATTLMRQERQRYLVMRTASIAIQRYYRGYKQMKQERKELEVKRKAVLNLQKYIRGYLVRRKYADYFTPEARAKREEERKIRGATVKIQAFWRGHKARSSFPELAPIRQRAKTANLKAEPQNTLQSRCDVALQALINENSTMFTVNKTLEDLEFITRHSNTICIQVAPFLPEQMYLMIKTTNRSLPEMTACVFSVNILINVFKYPPTRPYSFCPQYIDNIITVMLHWCDKEAPLFPAMCTLLWLFAHVPQWKRSIRSLSNIKHMFSKIQAQVARKQGMVKRAGVKGLSLFSPYKNLPIPSCEPDWGLVRKDNPYVFTNSVHAFSSLQIILNL